MNIALDYDGTFTEDPVLWVKFILLSEAAGHNVMIVTFRGDDTPVEYKFDIPVYYTNAFPKKRYMESRGIKIDVWIDDNPDLIINHSDWSLADRAAWKKANGFG